ncbi:hypothetical protein SANA_08640 [Gottschalkiaceae bacterium SANA]|nr:hypothetical protein SANA_08640 [Gottschalkiaceae bacterium SANA]
MEKKRLYRNEKGGKVGGVCQGLAEYFGIDSTMVRVAFLLLLFLPGQFPIVLIYIILWVVLPEKKNVVKVYSEEEVVVEMKRAKDIKHDEEE